METVPLPSRDTEKRSVSRALRLTLIVSVIMAIALIALLVLASANSALFERHYTSLLWANIALAVALLVLILELTRRLVRRYRSGAFGTRLTVRLAMSFIVMTIVPSLLIYVISVQVLGRSVESWFDVPVERALESGLNLGRASLDAQINDLNAKAKRIEQELIDAPPSTWPTMLDRLRDQLGVQDAMVMTVGGKVLASSGGQFAKLLPDFPTPNAIRQARATRQYAAIEGGEGSDKSLRVRSLRLLAQTQTLDEARLLQLIQTVPSSLAENAEAVQRGQRDYQELSLSRAGLKRIYRVTLTLTLVLTMFSAIAAAFLLSGWLTGPLSMLAAGTKAVAEGDFRPMKDYRGRDELGALTESFNRMTRQLDDARAQVQAQRDELLETNLRLEGVLGNISASVLVLDEHLCLTLANSASDRLLQGPWSKLVGLTLEELPFVHRLATQIREKFSQIHASGATVDDSDWQLQTELTSNERDPQSALQTWVLKGARLPNPNDTGVGYLVVIEDISDLVAAQRAGAWSEVARRLAHEIKNPLTPIQLAAERLDQKLTIRLDPSDAELLHRNTRTIVNQVNALKNMVDEFRDYARLPSAQLVPVALGDLLADVLSLYPDGVHGIGVQQNIQAAIPKILGDASQLRQVLHNLLKNAAEALEGQVNPKITVSIQAIEAPRLAIVGARAQTVVSAAKAPDTDRRAVNVTGVCIVVQDNGPGFSSKVGTRAFEPYVTTKAKGTGLGLAIVKKIVDDHGALIEISPVSDAASPVGAQIKILFTRLHESREQNPLQSSVK